MCVSTKDELTAAVVPRCVKSKLVALNISKTKASGASCGNYTKKMTKALILELVARWCDKTVNAKYCTAQVKQRVRNFKVERVNAKEGSTATVCDISAGLNVDDRKFSRKDANFTKDVNATKDANMTKDANGTKNTRAELGEEVTVTEIFLQVLGDSEVTDDFTSVKLVDSTSTPPVSPSPSSPSPSSSAPQTITVSVVKLVQTFSDITTGDLPNIKADIAQSYGLSASDVDVFIVTRRRRADVQVEIVIKVADAAAGETLKTQVAATPPVWTELAKSNPAAATAVTAAWSPTVEVTTATVPAPTPAPAPASSAGCVVASAAVLLALVL